jgi:nickel/cobalt transporter (NicO) family protein
VRALRPVRLLAVPAVVVAVLLAAAGGAAAHPLGNFTTNRFARVEVGASLARVHYVLDEAELVAFRSRDEVAADREAFVDRRVAAIREGLRLEVGDRPVALTAVRSRLTEPAGDGGLRTLRLEVIYEGRLPRGGGAASGSFADGNQPDRLGWREIVVRGVDGARVLSSSVPATSPTDGLRSYPEDRASASLDVRSATFRFVPGSGTDSAASWDPSAAGRPSGTGDDRFLRLLDSTGSSPVAVAGALLVALVFGAVHAVGPGHGKTVMAAYLVSTSGRRRDAVALGGVVSLMHTASVLGLAAVLATVGREVRADRLYPGLTVVAGVLVVAVGVQLLRRRVRARRSATADVAAPQVAHVVRIPALVGGPAAVSHDHDHDHGNGHGHGGDHPHDHDHPHGHRHGDDHRVHEHGPGGHTHELPAGVRPLSRAGLLALGTSGGLFPSPSAVVVLVGAFALGRATLGLALVGAFSLGLAAVLIGIGLLLVAGRDRLAGSRFAGRTFRWLPIAGAGAITVLGLTLVAQGVAGLR